MVLQRNYETRVNVKAKKSLDKTLLQGNMGNQQRSPEQGNVQRLSKACSHTVSRVGETRSAEASLTIGIYSITNTVDGKVYVGKSKNIESRWSAHRCNLTKTKSAKHCNRHLLNAVNKYGINAFKFEIIESFDSVDESLIAERELFHIQRLDSLNRKKGYNLRLDSDSKMIVHPETILLHQEISLGEKNPNYGNNWTREQKEKMSLIAKQRHASNLFYNDEWKKKISEKSTLMWQDEEKKKAMGENVSKATTRWAIDQLTKAGELVRSYSSVKEVVAENPGFKWQNIYSVCNGYKKSYMGFVWVKRCKI